MCVFFAIQLGSVVARGKPSASGALKSPKCCCSFAEAANLASLHGEPSKSKRLGVKNKLDEGNLPTERLIEASNLLLRYSMHLAESSKSASSRISTHCKPLLKY